MQQQPVYCPECGAVVFDGQLDGHLQQAHRIYQFRGERASREKIQSIWLRALLCDHSDPDAWQRLEDSAREEHGANATEALAALVRAGVVQLPAENRVAVLGAAAIIVGAGKLGPVMAGLLATDPDPVPRQLALMVTAHLPIPVSKQELRSLRLLLRDKDLPASLQVAAAAGLLRTMGTKGIRATRTLKALIAGRGKLRGLERLHQLREQLGACPALEELHHELEQRLPMRCPRCGVKMRRKAMIVHLWQEHHLVLDHVRVREPWVLIEEWIEASKQQSNIELLTRCCALAERIDPEHGLRRVQRLCLARGIQDEEAFHTLQSEAAERGASLCPHCYALVAALTESPPSALSIWRGRLTMHGYRVEVSEAGLFAWLAIETPRGMLTRGFEPGRRLTRSGAMLFLVGPFVALALTLALDLGGFSWEPLLPVVLLLLAALVVYLVVRWYWQPRVPAIDRAIDYGWTLLAPRLHADGFSFDDSAFLASLALASMNHGQADLRQPILERLMPLTERVVAAGFGGAMHLAALRRLELADACATGKDRVLLVTAEVDSCFNGKLPLAYAQGLLADYEKESWTPAELARLRILLCNSAFEAGFEIRNLIEAGETAPALGSIMETKFPDGLAQLRLLWSLRPRRPWEQLGSVATVFEIAGDAMESDVLGRVPDLLLWQELTAESLNGVRPWPASDLEIILCSRGIIFQGTLFATPPGTVEILLRESTVRGRYELVMGGHHFRFDRDPQALVRCLERWFRYYFSDFIPRVAEVHRWQSPDATTVLRAWGSVRCPECQRALLPRRGDVGVAISDA